MNDHKVRVILVEDHELFRKMFKEFINNVDGCEVVAEAKCGIEAIHAIQTVNADLVVLDFFLPRLNGLSVLKESKKTSSIKILVVTMSSDPVIVQQARDAGADGICMKDKGHSVLEKAIIETLEGKKPEYV